MKKTFTLALASLFTLGVMAADRRPSVTIQSARNYEIVIDGKTYASGRNMSMDIKSLKEGRHTISVYKVSQGFRKMKKLVSTSAFQLRNNDVSIFIDQAASIRIVQEKFGRDNVQNDRNDRNDRDRDWDDQNDRGRKDGNNRF